MKSQAAKQAKPVRQNSNTPSSAARPAHDASGLADQRPDALAQAQLLGLINGSAQVMQQKALGESINNSSRMVAQRQAHDAMFGAVAQREAQAAPPPNQTGLPDNLKAGVEALSGISLDHVRVHYNSPQPAQLNAHAYAQGSEIHVAPGQAHHLPHEAWHVVQQAQGRVQATTQMKGGVAVNDDKGLETEADVMGARALQLKSKASGADHALPQTPGSSCAIVQRVPTALTAAAFDNGVPAYTPGAFATVYASVSTTRNNHNGGSAPADPINANRIRSGHWQGEDYQLAMGAGPGQQTIAWVQGGISAGGAGNQLTRVHIIHHGLGAGTNNNPSNIFWGNPGFNNPQILVEETRMLNHLAAGGRPNLFNGGVTLTNDYYGVAGNNNVVPYMGQWYANANATIPALSPALAPASAAAVAVNNAFGTA
ncbi:MAG: hypothetical protein RL748_1422, partial [Pseudomonadota bacterium]